MTSKLIISIYGMFIPLMAAGPSPFPAAEKDQNAAAAPDALKVSAQAQTILPHHPPWAEEESLLMGAASVAHNKNIRGNQQDSGRIALQ